MKDVDKTRLASLMLFDFLAPVGQRTLHHKSDTLETVVLVNPSEDTVASEVCFKISIIIYICLHFVIMI